MKTKQSGSAGFIKRAGADLIATYFAKRCHTDFKPLRREGTKPHKDASRHFVFFVPAGSSNIHPCTKKSKQLFERAQQTIPGGLNSPVRAFKSVGGTLFMKSAKALICLMQMAINTSIISHHGTDDFGPYMNLL